MPVRPGALAGKTGGAPLWQTALPAGPRGSASFVNQLISSRQPESPRGSLPTPSCPHTWPRSPGLPGQGPAVAAPSPALP